MAKVSLDLPFTGSLGNCSVYKMRGVDKLIIRSKGGPDKNKIKTDPVFETLRYNNAEFSGCGKAASTIRMALYGLWHLADYNFSGSLTAIAKEIQKMDMEHNTGSRSIIISKHKDMLIGFNLNREHIFDQVVKHSPACSISRDTLSASVHFPAIFPKINISSPWNLGYYRFVTTMGIVPDMAKIDGAYVPVHNNLVFNQARDVSEWYETGQKAALRETHLSFDASTIIDQSATIMVSVGIEFGKMVKGMPEHVKYGGCARILDLQ